jgi:hypothetical protein
MLTLEEFAQRVYGGMVRIREGYEHHGKQCRCHICEGARIIRVAFDELERSGQWSSIPKCFRTERTVEPMNSLIMPHWHCKLCGYPLPIGTRQPGFHQTCPSCKTEYAWHPFGEYDLPNITSTKPKPSRVDGMLRDLRKGIDDMLGEGVSSGNPTLIRTSPSRLRPSFHSKPKTCHRPQLPRIRMGKPRLIQLTSTRSKQQKKTTR